MANAGCQHPAAAAALRRRAQLGQPLPSVLPLGGFSLDAAAAAVCAAASSRTAFVSLPGGGGGGGSPRGWPSSAAATALVAAAAAELSPAFSAIDAVTTATLRRVLAAFAAARIDASHFASVDGYGHGDLGRDAIDAVVADLFGAPAAAVRVQFLSGTHAIAAALFGVARPGDEVLAAAGPVYDTLEEVLGIRRGSRAGVGAEEEEEGEGGVAGMGSLADWGVSFRQVPLTTDATGGRVVDPPAVAAAVGPATKIVFIQRSCGYDWRRSLTIAEIRDVICRVRAVKPGVVVIVDNCYGEFTEAVEPTHPSVGADLAAGSLTKNPGGTLAPTGGYVTGSAHLVARALARLAAPGVGGGATLGVNRVLLQGLFMAPAMVGEAAKGAALVAAVFRRLGYATSPGMLAVAAPSSAGVAKTVAGNGGVHGNGNGNGDSDGGGDLPPLELIHAIRLGDRSRLLAFCGAVQRSSPVGAHITVEAGGTPGYGDEVVFASGTFVDGGTLELSADGPVRPPYVVYVQGGVSWCHWAIAAAEAAEAVGYADGHGPPSEG
ncbi:hypothetical protein MMPV_003628 [Pyropia vietnamensis]